MTTNARYLSVRTLNRFAYATFYSRRIKSISDNS